MDLLDEHRAANRKRSLDHAVLALEQEMGATLGSEFIALGSGFDRGVRFTGFLERLVEGGGLF
jgi:hypothetical protein